MVMGKPAIFLHVFAFIEGLTVVYRLDNVV